MPEITTQRIVISVILECIKIKITSHSHTAASNPIMKYFAFFKSGFYLFTWYLFQPSLRYATHCSAAATPALKLASAV